MRRLSIIAAIITTSTVGLSQACTPGDTAPAQAIAAVDDRYFTVDEAAQLLAPYTGFLNTDESIRSLADLWVEYMLVGQALGNDEMLESVDLEPVRSFQERQQAVLILRDAAITPDTVVTEADIQEAYEEAHLGAEITARHILLAPPPNPTPADVDSARAAADTLRGLILGGADFEQMAIQFSLDRATAMDGGLLGTFGRGTMVAPVEEAAFNLEVGEISEPVQTQYGFHLIRVDERTQPPLDAVRDRAVELVHQLRQVEAEAAFIADVERNANLRIADGAAARLREMAENPGRQLTPGRADDALVEFEGGEVTAGEARLFLLTQLRDAVFQVRNSPPEQVEEVLRKLARQEILAGEAADRGLVALDEDLERAETALRQQAITAARILGLHIQDPRAGEDPTEVVHRVTLETLDKILSGDAQIIPFGPFMAALRWERDTRIFPERFSRVVERVEEIRSAPDFEAFSREPEVVDPTRAGNAAPDSSAAAGSP